MAYLGSEKQFMDFKGGWVTNRSNVSLGENEALDLDNVIVLPGGFGITNVRGNTTFNSSAMASGAAVTGLYYYLQQDQDEWLMAVAGTNIYKSDDLDGTMDSITGSVTITSDQDNIWDMITFNNTVIGFGGAPDAPWKWSGTGNASALGGSPPTADFCFTYNNRVFAGIKNTSTIYWSILGNAEDWTGDGSGNAVVGSLDDNQLLIGASPLTTDQALVFKERSVYQMATRNLVSGAFPIFPLHPTVGACGKHAIVNVDGEVYFVTSDRRMMSTNGARLLSYPPDIDNRWDELNLGRLAYIQGVHYHGIDHEWIIWIVSTGSSSTNNDAIVWDIRNQCWLRQSQGFKANIAATTIDGTLYTGHYDGKIYLQDVANAYTVASESGDAISWFWRTGWLMKTALKTIRPQLCNVIAEATATGTINFRVGFDFTEDIYTKTISITGGDSQWDVAEWDVDDWGSPSTTMQPARLKGRGNTIQFKLDGNDTVKYLVNGFAIDGHLDSGQKVLQAI